VRVRHAATVPDDPDRTYGMVHAIDLNRSRAIRMLFALRGLPSRRRVHPGGPHRSGPFLDSALAQGWKILEERSHEIVVGAVTQPWKPVVEFRGLPTPDEFIAFAEPGFAKIAWSIAVEAATGGSVVTLETRVLTTDPVSRRRFRWYWLVFSPGIKLIRHLILALLRRELRRDRSAFRPPQA